MVRKIYQIYSTKSLRKNIAFKYACVISVILAVSILFSMQNILDAYSNDLSDRIEAMNGSEVKVFNKDYLKHEFSKEQILDLEKNIDVDYTMAFCDNSNIIARKRDDMAATMVLNNKNIITRFGINSLNEGEVVISKNIAKRLNIHIGDNIYIKLHSTKYADREFKVVQILNDTAYFSVAGNEYEITQETLGCVYIVLPEFERFNTVYVEKADDSLLNILNEIFAPTFEIRTLQDFENNIKSRVQIQMEILKLISSLAMIISSICLVWSFLVFIIDRKDDFLIFKKIGIRSIDLAKLLLIEMYSIIIKGIILGIPLGGLISAIYFQINDILSAFTIIDMVINIILVIGLVLIETAVFSLIPISSIIKSINNNDYTISASAPILTKIVVGIIIMLLSCIYVQSFSGIVFGGIVGIIFGAFYMVFTTLISVVIKFLSFKQNKNFLWLCDLKNDIKIISMPLSIINVGMVIFFILLNVLPMLYSPIEQGSTIEKSDIVYRTDKENEEVENIIKDEDIGINKCYLGEVKILQINGVEIAECINSNIAESYKEESIEELSNREINIYENEYESNEYLDINGIYVNNIYQNIVDFKEKDYLVIELNGKEMQCQVCGVYEDADNKDIVGILPKEYIINKGYSIEECNMTVMYTLSGNIGDNIAMKILLNDENSYLDRNQQLTNYLKKYIDQQKLVFVSIISAVSFAGILLVILAQTMIFVQKREYYISLWKIGMSRGYLISTILVQKILLSIIQTVVITIFIEPIRFLINAEMSSGKYTISSLMIIVELIIILGINLISVIIPFLTKQKANC